MKHALEILLQRHRRLPLLEHQTLVERGEHVVAAPQYCRIQQPPKQYGRHFIVQYVAGLDLDVVQERTRLLQRPEQHHVREVEIAQVLRPVGEFVDEVLRIGLPRRPALLLAGGVVILRDRQGRRGVQPRQQPVEHALLVAHW